MAIGTGIASPQVTDTTLQTELLRKIFSSKTKGTIGKITYEMTLTTAEGNGNNLSEVGVLNASSGGDLLNRLTFKPIAKTSDFELKIEIDLEVRRKN